MSRREELKVMRARYAELAKANAKVREQLTVFLDSIEGHIVKMNAATEEIDKMLELSDDVGSDRRVVVR